jgi:diguanylate cyclase (GGDEF)-like protein/excisionase family DNA binding protein
MRTGPNAGTGHREGDPLVTPASSATDPLARRLAELERQRLYDPLTGLPNRTLLGTRLEESLARAASADAAVAILVCDLDRFATVNDTLGQHAGDDLLRAVAHRLGTADDGLVARTSGDEFVVLREHVRGERAAIEAAERLTAALRTPFALDQDELFLSASIGVATSDRCRAGAESLLSAAAVAMSQAKAQGGGRYEVFDEGMRRRGAERVKLETDLRRALDADELTLHYQPLVSLTDGAICALEALVRWQHPRRGLVAPSAFLPVAEESGLIVPLSRWVLREALRQAARWEASSDIRIPYLSVNVSGRHLAEPGLAGEIEDELARAGVAPERLGLELTETVLMEETSAPAAVVQQLKQLGVRVLLDDFGTGYSSLNYLKSFPLDAIKLDRTFVEGVTEDGVERHVVRAVVSLGHALGHEVIAEGVESREQASWLASLGCGVAQGYAFARPAPAETVEALLREGLPAARRPRLGVTRALDAEVAVPPHPPARELPSATLSVSDAAEALGVSSNTLRRWADAGRIKAIRTAGGHRRFLASEVRRLNATVGAPPALRRTAPPAGPLPALGALLAATDTDLAALAARAVYEASRPGWFQSDAARASVRAWEAGLGTAARSGDCTAAVTATRRLASSAEYAGTSLLERHAFVERYGDLAVRRLQHLAAPREEVLDARRLFVRLRETLLEASE